MNDRRLPEQITFKIPYFKYQFRAYRQEKDNYDLYINRFCIALSMPFDKILKLKEMLSE